MDGILNVVIREREQTPGHLFAMASGQVRARRVVLGHAGTGVAEGERVAMQCQLGST